MDYSSLSTSELAKLISPESAAFRELKKRNILRSKNIVGELGEHYAISFFNKKAGLPNLSLAQVTVKNIDALSRNGETYSIKTISSKKGTTGSFWDPDSIEKNEKKFDYLLIVILNNGYQLDMILELTWKDFFKHKRFNKRMNNYNIQVTKQLMSDVKIIFDSEIDKQSD